MNSAGNLGLYLVIRGSLGIISGCWCYTVIIIIMFITYDNLSLLALIATVSAKECYDAAGTFDLTEGSLNA